MTHTTLRNAVAGLALLGALAPAAAFAQAASPTAVLVVDMSRVFSESAAGQDADRQLKSQADQLQSRFNQLQTQFNSEADALRKQEGQIAPEALKQKADDLNARMGKANEEINVKKQALDRAAEGANKQIQSNLGPIITQLMSERSAQLILNKQITLAVAPALDVTAVVIQRLNAKLPKVTVTVPTAPAAAPAPAAPPKK